MHYKQNITSDVINELPIRRNTYAIYSARKCICDDNVYYKNVIFLYSKSLRLFRSPLVCIRRNNATSKCPYIQCMQTLSNKVVMIINRCFDLPQTEEIGYYQEETICIYKNKSANVVTVSEPNMLASPH